MVSFDETDMYSRQRSSADAKRLVIAVDEARSASLIAYFRIGCPVQTLNHARGIEVDGLFVCLSLYQ